MMLYGTTGMPQWLVGLDAEVGRQPVKSGVEVQRIMQEVARYLSPDSWQYCTINSWLLGTPSEDDLTWKAKYFSEMPRLEETCGDHTTFGSQYNEAFDDLKSTGAPTSFITWLRNKRTLKPVKTAIAETEGEQNIQKGIDAAKKAVFFQVGVPSLLIGGVVAYLLLRDKK